MAFEIPSRLHSYPLQGFGIVERDLSHYGEQLLSNPNEEDRDRVGGSVRATWLYLQLVSAKSSFLRLILSFRPSASLLAAVILACICSPVKSEDIARVGGPLGPG